jgi:hypothetical protein
MPRRPGSRPLRHGAGEAGRGGWLQPDGFRSADGDGRGVRPVSTRQPSPGPGTWRVEPASHGRVTHPGSRRDVRQQVGPADGRSTGAPRRPVVRRSWSRRRHRRMGATETGGPRLGIEPTGAASRRDRSPDTRMLLMRQSRATPMPPLAERAWLPHGTAARPGRDCPAFRAMRAAGSRHRPLPGGGPTTTPPARSRSSGRSPDRARGRGAARRAGHEP